MTGSCFTTGAGSVGGFASEGGETSLVAADACSVAAVGTGAGALGVSAVGVGGAGGAAASVGGWIAGSVGGAGTVACPAGAIAAIYASVRLCAFSAWVWSETQRPATNDAAKTFPSNGLTCFKRKKRRCQTKLPLKSEAQRPR